MKKFNSLYHAILLCAFLSFICGGCGSSSGGDDDDDAGWVDTNQPLALTGNNAVPVSGLLIDAVEGGITAGSLGPVVASVESNHVNSFKFNVLRLTRDVLDLVLDMPPVTTNFISAALVPPNVNCTGGGTITQNWNDSPPLGELSIGDGITLLYKNCVEEGLTYNGELEVGVLDMVGDPTVDPSWMVVLRLNFNSLTASQGSNIVEILGSLDVTVDTQISGVVLTEVTTEVGLGPGPKASSLLYFGEGDDFTELTLFSVSFQENPDGSFVIYSQGTLESTFIGGTVTFETTLDLTGTDFDVNNPSAGEVLIIGAINSSVLLRILDSIFVELDVDDEGDGFDAGDTTLPRSWNDLQAAADAL